MGFSQNSTFGFGSTGDISGGGTVNAAANGLSLVGGNTVVLGQDVGQVGNPATLLSIREIPIGIFTVNFKGITQSAVIGPGTFSIIDATSSTTKTLSYNATTSTLMAGPLYSQLSNYSGYADGAKLSLTGCTGITTYGDSFTGGFASENPLLIYPRQLSAFYSLTLTNSGVNSGGWYTTVRNIFLRNFLTSTRVDFVTMFTGLIDVISNMSSFRNKNKIEGLAKTALANLFTVSAVPFSDASVTKSGFSNTTVACQSRSTVLGGSVIEASVSGSTLSFSFTGTDLVIGTYASIVGNIIGGFNIVIDGVNGSGGTYWRQYNGSETFVGEGQYTLANETGLTIYPNCFVIRGLAPGAHTCVITTIASVTTPMDYFAVLDIPANVKPVVIGSIPHVDENVSLNYGVPYNPYTNKDADSVNDIIRKVCADFYDYPLSLVNINKYYFAYTMVRRPDNLHPKTIGQNSFFAGFVNGVNVKRIEDMSAEPWTDFNTGAPKGQTIMGGTLSGENLTLSSTSNTTKGKILFGNSAYDELNNRLGIGTTAPTTDVHIVNSVIAGIRMSADNVIIDHSGNSSSQILFGNGGIIRTSIHNFVIEQPSAMGAVGSYNWIKYSNPNQAQTSGDGVGILSDQTFNPTSGTATHTSIKVNGVINQTGGANGITRGILIDQGLSSVADYRALEIANNSHFAIYQFGSSAKNYINGQTGFGNATPDSSARVQIDSTTQGFLVPRMTTTDRNAISSPASGLMVYNTSTNKMNLYTTSWEEMTSV